MINSSVKFSYSREWNKLTPSEIDDIIKIYLRENSIVKTSKILGYSKNTVNKYVKHISSKSKNSRYTSNVVYQINPLTGEIINKFFNSNIASKHIGISLSSLNKCLKGSTKSCQGYCWCYEKDYKNFIVPTGVKSKYYSEKRINGILQV